MMKDIFRPHSNPTRLIYDAFQAEAEKRGSKNTDDWIIAERLVVWQTAKDYAQQKGLRVPTLEELELFMNTNWNVVDEQTNTT